jgi:hypothetical protein
VVAKVMAGFLLAIRLFTVTSPKMWIAAPSAA